MKKIDKLTRQSIGMAGTYNVAAELFLQNLVATVTSRNAKGVDILAASADGLQSVSIQVKTSSGKYNRGKTKKWRLDHKAEKLISDNLFYVFVNLGHKGTYPEFFVVPSKVVAEYTHRSYNSWIHSKSKRTGKRHKKTTMRNFQIKGDKEIEIYKNKWGMLGIGGKQIIG